MRLTPLSSNDRISTRKLRTSYTCIAISKINLIHINNFAMSILRKIRHRLICSLPYFLRKNLSSLIARIRSYRGNSTKNKLKELRDLIIFNHPVHQVPQATGKLRLLQEGNAVLLSVFAEKCQEHNLR